MHKFHIVCSKIIQRTTKQNLSVTEIMDEAKYNTINSTDGINLES